VVLGNQAMFTATVTNTTDTAASWSVNTVPGGNATLGTITSAGLYTAPADLPPPAPVQVTATSHADATKSGTANVAVTSDITLNLTPNPASMELGASQTFQVAVTSSGHPDTAIRWSLSGAACASGCGAVDASGKYTAPQILPSPASATLGAQSVANPSKQISAAVAIASNFSLHRWACGGAQLHCLRGSAEWRGGSFTVRQCDCFAVQEYGYRRRLAAAAGMRGACGGCELHGADSPRTLKREVRD